MKVEQGKKFVLKYPTGAIVIFKSTEEETRPAVCFRSWWKEKLNKTITKFYFIYLNYLGCTPYFVLRDK